MNAYPKAQGLYLPGFEHDACGVGFVCHMKGLASHQVVRDAIQVLENMVHRGACGCEPDSGDGAGILVRIPDAFLRRECAALGIELPPVGQYGVGQIFFPADPDDLRDCMRIFEDVCRHYDLEILGWRDVPVDDRYVGPTPKRSMPDIKQVFLKPNEHFYNKEDFDRRLYLVRQRAENLIEFNPSLSENAREHFYICILSDNRVVYKGMLTAEQLQLFYPDLRDPDFQSSLAMVHSRFSTNTFPSWRLAHPYRYLAHNGEINTLRGNRNWMRARYGSLHSEVFGDELSKMLPILTETGSDSATIDNALQFLVVNGRPLPQAVLMLIPEAWENHALMDPDLKAFYEYNACLMEPWDGPASIAFTDGHLIGAVLDRNGLRPSRYYVTSDDLVIMASEVGVLRVPPEKVVKKWRLQPGKIFLIDTELGRIVEDDEIKAEMIDKRPWRLWLDEYMVELDVLPAPNGGVPRPDHETLLVRQHAFGYTTEDIKLILSPMAAAGAESVGSMGTDSPLACLSDKPQLLYNYFRQLFAQVTNPPLDAMREELVTSSITYLGRRPNLLDETPRHCHLVKLKQPILRNEDLVKLRSLDGGDFAAVTLDATFDAAAGAPGLREAMDRLRADASKAIAEGVSIVVLSDRAVSAQRAPVPMLLAVSGVHHHLIREGTRTLCSLVAETGEAREAHHLCLLLGYGASAINPYLAFETFADLERDGELPVTYDQAVEKYIKAANKAVLKVASKMGISTVASYAGAQIFEAVGLSTAFVEEFFTHTPSRIDGVGLDVIAVETLERHRKAYPPVVEAPIVLENGGLYQWRADGEHHMWNPDTVAKLQIAVRSDLEAAEKLKAGYDVEAYRKFREYTAIVDDESRRRCTIRGLLKIKESATPVPLEEVEPAAQIVKRFVTGAMSFGSISREAHENLAIAMNRIGGKSNTGEGGEDPDRFRKDPNGDWRRSAIKQVASGRFGVTTEYLVNAQELQIKMAQGAKPGEGGQLPGHKVDEYVGKIRYSTPGVGLISPPPHHDIYSIEDLAQLIHDLKNSNPEARVSVKLVSEVGVGTVAAGVAKAKSDHILISGDSGGTGASPLTSIKYAGLPWELGISETQQTLVLNDLRSRVVLQTDGQLKTGRDVVVGALLGADEFGFSTAPLIASGCVMMRVCHLNTCPVGIATQDPELRKKFSGKPEHVINFMFFVAEQVREYMAKMGFRRFDEMIGQTRMLEVDPSIQDHWKARHLDLTTILHRPDVPEQVKVHHCMSQDHGLEGALDTTTLLKLASPALEGGEKVFAMLPIANTNRTVGTILSGRIAKKYGFDGLPDDTITFEFKGSAGQSFGAFLARGVTLTLKGDANDYLGKGLSGGKIAVFPPAKSTFKAQENIIAGNVICYGAIAGEVYLRGVVGERFCVRNSGVRAVVEGVGDHGCEYMTGGRVVVLGPTGRNFAAGMSGGIAYVLDPTKLFAKELCNLEMVTLADPLTDEDVATIRRLIENHVKYTGSEVGQAVLADFDRKLEDFVKVMPTDYKRVLEHQAEIEERARMLAENQARS